MFRGKHRVVKQKKENMDSVQGSAPEDDKPLEFFGKSNY